MTAPFFVGWGGIILPGSPHPLGDSWAPGRSPAAPGKKPCKRIGRRPGSVGGGNRIKGPSDDLK